MEDVQIDLEDGETVFVGPNNSGKTSATAVFRYFLKGTVKEEKGVKSTVDRCWLFKRNHMKPLRGDKLKEVDEVFRINNNCDVSISQRYSKT